MRHLIHQINNSTTPFNIIYSCFSEYLGIVEIIGTTGRSM